MNYWDYIRVEELLALQGGAPEPPAVAEAEAGAASPRELSNDETLFIVVHQIYELWFKLILRELTTARDLFSQNPVPDVQLASAVRSLRRVTVIFEQAAAHFRVMETLTTRDYLDFRDQLIPASGFQSAQMREIEILLGLDDGARVSIGHETYKDALRGADGSPSPATARVERRLGGGPSLKHVLYEWLSRTPVDQAAAGGDTDEGITRFLAGFVAAHRSEIERRIGLAQKQALGVEEQVRLRARYEAEAAFAEAFLLGTDDPAAEPETRRRRRRVRAGVVFLESYRELPRLAWPREVVDAVIEMEQSMLIWRQRHARMVERIIGRRVGTGGSAGVDYLDQTALRYRVFADIWGVRSLLLRKPSVPAIEHEGDYRFRVED